MEPENGKTKNEKYETSSEHFCKICGKLFSNKFRLNWHNDPH